MSAATTPTPTNPPRWKTIAELLTALGGVPADRVRFEPFPGTATEADVLAAARSGTLCELVDGTLVEKPVGVPEAFLASLLIQFLGPFVRTNNLGITTTPDGMYRMLHGNIREPDVSYTRRERLPSPLPQVGGWCPDLCVEILSPSNTRAEMARKRQEYFTSGCQLVWEIDPRGRTADVYTDPTTVSRLDESGVLDGGPVLPGFTLALAELFAEYDAVINPPTVP